ncbi:response regulator transcription factor [Neobacillus drentensis]|uniref:response regulator transcription factor n=1 Tax=Neobacillus drentensis TaxID=220684 RepID=UPI001F3C4069|nr:response regulator transcription factor [Neobacillus drentensis]ULT57537.1 response regulator transcription factor [Neobacillus drentensis]
MNVLLAEDDNRLGDLMVYMLKKKGNCNVEWVKEGHDAFYFATSAHYDVVIMDWMMPNGDGVDVCKGLRKQGYSGAILMLTAKDTVQDRIEGLDSGADDYLVKPFEFDELLARLRALSRRNYAPIVEEEMEIDGLVLNRASHMVRFEDIEIQFSPREFQLLDLLMKNKGQVLPRELIYERVWGVETDVTMKTIDATVKLIRKKLSLISKQSKLQSIRGVGYKFET